MPGDIPYEAFQDFRELLQRAFSCVNSAAHVWALVGSNGYRPGQEHALAPNGGEPVPLSGGRRLSLVSLFRYRVVGAEGEHGSWRVETSAYAHTLEDEEGQEIVAYHWHPSQSSVYDFPHLHIGVGIGASLGEVHKYHIPTARIAVEDVIRFAIMELGATPQRDDWEQVLNETSAAFREQRTWT